MSKLARLPSIISGDDRTVAGTLLRFALGCLKIPYQTLVAIRNAGFDASLRHRHRLGRTTISVGNLTTGGTGKTPLVIDLTRRLLARAAGPAILLRGYKAGRSGSDEAHMIRDELGPAVLVEAHGNRCAAAERVLKTRPEVDVFLLDDGFQHRQVHRDLDVVLVDATQPFGFGHVLPRGLLREPVKNLRRADAVIVTRADSTSPAQIADLDHQIRRATGKRPIAHAVFRWEQYADPGGATYPLDILRPSRVVGVCGVGNPTAFERSLRAHVGQVITVHALPDHHHYDRRRLNGLLQDAITRHADAVVTTHKDMVKWRPLLGGEPTPVPIYYPVIRVAFIDGEQDVEALLREVVSK